ncbi:MAG: ABC transporter permease [Ardenticatenaceae bacterium]
MESAISNTQNLSFSSASELTPPDSLQDLVLEPLENDKRSVSILEISRLALGSLMANKMRSLLTMLGVIIGVGSVVALLSLGDGASASITGQVEALGTNLLTIVPGSPNSRGPGGSSSAQTLTIDDAYAIEALKLPVLGMAPQFSSNAQLVALAADTNASIVGSTPDFLTLNNLSLGAGVFFDEGHVRSASPVIILGSTVATDLFGSGQAIGQTIKVKSQSLRVIGVLAEKGGGGFGSTDDQAFVPISTAQKRLFGGRSPDGNSYLVSNIVLSAESSEDMPVLEERIEFLLRERHNLAFDGSSDDFRILNQAEFLETLSTITGVFTMFMAAVASISLLVGGIGIMNIMLVSVTERTREIGLRKAVGARGQDILLQFVVEAIVLSLVGGLLGLAFGGSIALAVTYSGYLDAPVTLNAVLLSIGFSMAVGLFFGIYPAQRAAKLNPIDALRYE